MPRPGRMKTEPTGSGIEQAIAKAGGYKAFAKALKPVEKHNGSLGPISVQVVYLWVRRGWVPVMRALEIEGLYGIDRSLLVKPQLRELVGEPAYDA